MYDDLCLILKQTQLDPLGAANQNRAFSTFRLGPHEPPSVHSLADLNTVLHQEVTSARWCCWWSRSSRSTKTFQYVQLFNWVFISDAQGIVQSSFLQTWCYWVFFSDVNVVVVVFHYMISFESEVIHGATHSFWSPSTKQTSWYNAKGPEKEPEQGPT